jgi:hypothetical protein
MAVGRDGQNLIGAERDESGNRDSSVNERYPHAPRSHGMTGRPRCARMPVMRRHNPQEPTFENRAERRLGCVKRI